MCEKDYWFSVKVKFVCDVDDNIRELEKLYEYSIRLFKAKSEDEAFAKAVKYFQQEDCSYKNINGNEVSWNFVEIIEIQDLYEEEIFDGIEVFSRLEDEK